MSSLLPFQIITDIAFFVVIMLLLRQLNRRVGSGAPKVDAATVGELKKLMTESRESADLFLRTVRESEERLNKLARQLDSREKRIVILIEKAESLIQKMASSSVKPESDGETYRKILRMVQGGLSREEVAKRLGVTMGEIELVVELEQTKADVHKQDLSDRQGAPTGNLRG